MNIKINELDNVFKEHTSNKIIVCQDRLAHRQLMIVRTYSHKISIVSHRWEKRKKNMMTVIKNFTKQFVISRIAYGRAAENDGAESGR